MIGGTPGGNAGSPFSLEITVTDSNSATASRIVTLAVNTAAACATDGDGAMDVREVQEILNEALGRSQPAHDFNRNGSVEVTDVQTVVNALLHLGCAAR